MIGEPSALVAGLFAAYGIGAAIQIFVLIAKRGRP